MRVIVPVSEDLELPEFSRVILEEERSLIPNLLEKVELDPQNPADPNNGGGVNE